MHRSDRGFSILELLVVVVIIGIVAVVTGTWYGATQPAAVKGTVNSLVGALSDARTVAQSTGRTVTLTTSGVQSTLTITFPSQGDVLPVPANQALTTWRRDAAGRDATRYSGIDTSSAWPIYTQAVPNPDPLTGGVGAISDLFTNGVNPGTSAKLFTGTTNSAFSFDSTGRASADFYVYVGGMRDGSSYRSAPVGLVLVTRANGIHAFYKPNAGDPASPWQRL
jgi:prepilin-type N-terminal cleavage/methylation domain-containing protein